MADDRPTEPLHTADDSPIEPASYPPPPATARGGFDSDGWLRRNKVLAVSLAILAIYLVRTNLESRRDDGGSAGGTTSASGAATASAEPAHDGSEPVFVPRSTPAQTAAPSLSAQPEQAPTPEPKKEDIDFVMPDYTGRGLQSAQNDIQKHGVFFSRSDDLRGSRRQILDRNWKVCSQTPPAGERVAGSRAEVEGSIEFGVVKIDEDCP